MALTKLEITMTDYMLTAVFLTWFGLWVVFVLMWLAALVGWYEPDPRFIGQLVLLSMSLIAAGELRYCRRRMKQEQEDDPPIRH